MAQQKSASKIVIAIFVVLIVVLALVAVVPVLIAMAMGPGVRTEGLSAENAQPASTDINGQWRVTQTRDENTTSVGFTFFEILPSDRRETSGSTQDVEGYVTIEAGTLQAGEITVDMNEVSTDNERRDEIADKLSFIASVPSTFIFENTLNESTTSGKYQPPSPRSSLFRVASVALV